VNSRTAEIRPPELPAQATLGWYLVVDKLLEAWSAVLHAIPSGLPCQQEVDWQEID
jgi:hypothetical protein